LFDFFFFFNPLFLKGDVAFIDITAVHVQDSIMREVDRRRKLSTEVQAQRRKITELREAASRLDAEKHAKRIAALLGEVDEWEVSLKDTKEFLYCKLDLAIVCLILCTVRILGSNQEAVKEIHVARYDGVVERANALVNYEYTMLTTTANYDEDELVIEDPNQLEARSNLTCEVCGREIVNLYFCSSSDDALTAVYCPKHRAEVGKKRVKAFLLMHVTDLKKEFRKAVDAVRIWKEENK